MRFTRPIVWTVVAVVIVAAALSWLVPRLLGTDAARHEIEQRLSEALGRRVGIEALVVERGAPRVELRGVTISDPVEWSSADPMLTASSVTIDVGLDALRRGRLVGTAVARGVELHVVRRDGVANLQGLGRTRSEGRIEALELAIEIDDATVRIDDLDRAQSSTWSGVDVRAVVSNAEDGADAGLQVDVEQMDLAGVVVHDVMLSGAARDGVFTVHRVQARVGESGRVEGRGRIGGVGEAADWSFDLTLSDVALDASLADAVARLYPPLALSPAERPTGTLGATVSLSGAGLHRDAILPSLRGDVAVTLRNLEVPSTSLLGRLVALAGGGEGSLSLPQASAEVSIADGWVTIGGMESRGAPFDPHVRGRIGLDGRLELTADLMPLVEAFGGGVYEAAARYTTSLPVRIEGTLQDPELRPPAVRDVAAGLVGGLIRRAVTEPP